MIEDIGIGIGVFVTLLALVGGLLALPEEIRKFRLRRRPRGDRGTQFYLMSREDTHSHTIVEFLVADDLMHFLSSWGKAGGGATTLEVEQVGEFYRAKLQFPLGALDGGYEKVKK